MIRMVAQNDFGGPPSGNCLSLRPEGAEMKTAPLLAGVSNLRGPSSISRVLPDAQKASRIADTDFNIPGVLNPTDITKVFDPIVSAVTVDVVNLTRRHFAVKDHPRGTMG